MKNPINGVEHIAKAIEQDQCFRHWRSAYIRDMVECWAIALRNAVEPKDESWDAREADYMRHVKTYERPTMELWSDLLGSLTKLSMDSYGDHLGALNMMLANGNKQTGQFFTPYSVSKMMALLSVDHEVVRRQVKNVGYLAVNEPTCGSGSTVIAVAEVMKGYGFDPTTELRVTMQDIDKHCVNMSYVQMRLFEIPACVIYGNTLALECREMLLTPQFVGQDMKLRQAA